MIFLLIILANIKANFIMVLKNLTFDIQHSLFKTILLLKYM